jgi:hypothetical protein
MTRHFVRSVCLLSALAAATTVRAGILFTSPIPDANCGNVHLVGIMQDPNYFAVHIAALGVRECAALCKSAASACKRNVREVGACTLDHLANQLATELVACAVQSASPADARVCEGAIRDGFATERADAKSTVETEAASCAQWGSDCALFCSE